MEKNMGNKDIVIKDGKNKFNYRVAGIFEYDNKLLIQKSDKDTFYSLIGGRVKFNETSREAIKREIKEEIKFAVKEEKLKLVRIYENFFKYGPARYHELLFIYVIKVQDDDELEKNCDFYCSDKPTTKMLWIHKEKLQDMDIRPKEIKQVFSDDCLKHGVILD